MPEAAKELNVNQEAVYEWLKKHQEDTQNFMSGSGKQKPKDAENSWLIKENKQLKAEIEFLKKAAVYFAADHK